MNLVLAVEPDRSQGEILRRLFADQTTTKLVVVPSAYAAMTFLNREVPDAMLLSEALEAKAQEDVKARLRAVSDLVSPQVLKIPRLRDGSAQAPEKSGWFRSGAATAKKSVDPVIFAASV